jgi:hypothetical protein
MPMRIVPPEDFVNRQKKDEMRTRGRILTAEDDLASRRMLQALLTK